MNSTRGHTDNMFLPWGLQVNSIKGLMGNKCTSASVLTGEFGLRAYK